MKLSELKREDLLGWLQELVNLEGAGDKEKLRAVELIARLQGYISTTYQTKNPAALSEVMIVERRPEFVRPEASVSDNEAWRDDRA